MAGGLLATFVPMAVLRGLRYLLVAGWLGCGWAAQAQQRIEIINADETSYVKQGSREVRMLIGHVAVKQDSTIMYCDTAYQYARENRMEAHSNVQVVMSDSVKLYARRIDYDGNTRRFELYHNIRLTDGRTTLETQRMTYNRQGGVGYYQGGGKLYDDENTLTSLRGYYFARPKLARFVDSVKVRSPEYLLMADSLAYETVAKRSIFVAPTRIYNTTPGKKDEQMYTERGWYRSTQKITYLYQNSWLRDSAYTIYADTLYYADSTDRGWARCNVRIVRKDTSITVGGDRSQFQRRKRTSLMTENPYLVQRMEGDTLELYADTLYSVDDTLRGYQRMRAYRHVRFAMRDLQGRADSMEYDRRDSIMTFHYDPVLWSGDNQLSGDTIRVWLQNKAADSLRVYSNGFIASKETEKFYNQVQGKQMYGKLRKNKLVWMRVVGNAESIYYTKDGPKLTGMNQSSSKELIIFLKDNKPKKIQFITKPEGVYSPLHVVALQDNFLKRFRWRAAERPPRFSVGQLSSLRR